MKTATGTFLKGLLTILPALASVYVLIWFLNGVESVVRDGLLVFWPEFLYVTGMGVAVAALGVYAVGLVIDRPFARWFFNLTESLLSELPIIKTVFMAIKDFTRFLQPKEGGGRHNQVVVVKVPDYQVELIGLMTRENLVGLPDAITKEGKVAVYFPMSYQFGGLTVFIPRAWVHPTNLSVEQAMRSIITAWLPGGDVSVAVSHNGSTDVRGAQ